MIYSRQYKGVEIITQQRSCSLLGYNNDTCGGLSRRRPKTYHNTICKSIFCEWYEYEMVQNTGKEYGYGRKRICWVKYGYGYGLCSRSTE